MEEEQKEIISFTIVLHEVRLKLKLTLNEYCIADCIYNLSNNPKSEIKGWCYASKKKLGNLIGISETSVHAILKKLIKAKLVEKNEDTKYLRTTQFWYDNVILRRIHLRNLSPTKETLVKTLKKLKPDTKETLVNNNNISKINNTISKSEDLQSEELSSSKRNDASTPPKSPPPSKTPWTKEMLIWLEKEQGAKFANYGKQLKALGNLKKAGYTTEQIKECYKKMLKDDFWKSRHPDFVNIANNITKFIKKVDALEEARKLAHQ